MPKWKKPPVKKEHHKIRAMKNLGSLMHREAISEYVIAPPWGRLAALFFAGKQPFQQGTAQIVEAIGDAVEGEGEGENEEGGHRQHPFFSNSFRLCVSRNRQAVASRYMQFCSL